MNIDYDNIERWEIHDLPNPNSQELFLSSESVMTQNEVGALLRVDASNKTLNSNSKAKKVKWILSLIKSKLQKDHLSITLGQHKIIDVSFDEVRNNFVLHGSHEMQRYYVSHTLSKWKHNSGDIIFIDKFNREFLEQPMSAYDWFNRINEKANERKEMNKVTSVDEFATNCKKLKMKFSQPTQKKFEDCENEEDYFNSNVFWSSPRGQQYLRERKAT